MEIHLIKFEWKYIEPTYYNIYIYSDNTLNYKMW